VDRAEGKRTGPGWLSRRVKKQPERFMGLAAGGDLKVPTSYGEAGSSPQVEEWQMDTEDKLASLAQYGTWCLE
jgi:hypothetical protein